LGSGTRCKSQERRNPERSHSINIARDRRTLVSFITRIKNLDASPARFALL
jgi:translation initiation factor 1 (eIF-1/SUI1)